MKGKGQRWLGLDVGCETLESIQGCLRTCPLEKVSVTVKLNVKDQNKKASVYLGLREK